MKVTSTKVASINTASIISAAAAVIVMGPSIALGQTATSLDGTGSNADIRYDSGDGCWYIDADADATKDTGELCVEDENIRFARDFTSGSSTQGINEAIADCGKNASGKGCHVWLPAGEVLIDETIQIGGLGGSDQQYGITLHGYGSGIIDSVGGDRCGTTIRTSSSFTNDDAMIAVDGSIHWRIQDLCLEGNTNGKKAGYGILIRGDNTVTGCCANNHRGDIEYVTIDGITGSPGQGISIKGNNTDSSPGSPAGSYHADQADFIRISQARVEDSVECFRQDNQQAVANHLIMFECSGWTGTYGILVLQGGVIFDDVYFGAKEDDQVGLRWENQAIQMNATDLTFEWAGDDGVFVQFAGFGTGNQNTHTIRDSRFQSQFDATNGHTFIDYDGRRGTLNLIGNRFFVGSPGSMGDFDLDAADANVPSYINFLGNEYKCTLDSVDCSPTLNITNTGGGTYPTGGIRVTRQEEGVFRVYDENGSIGPSTVYQFHGSDIQSRDVGECLRADQMGTTLACGAAANVATTAVLSPGKPRIGAMTCAGTVTGSGSLDFAVRYRDGTNATNSTGTVTRSTSDGAATLSWTDIDETSPYADALVSVVVESSTSSPTGEVVCQVEVFH